MKRITRNLKVCEALVTFYYEDKIYTKNVIFPHPLSKKEVCSFLDLMFPGSKLLKVEPKEPLTASISLPISLLLNVVEERLVDAVRLQNNAEMEDIEDDNTGN